jgi:Tol biopolymer transport system component
MWCLVLLLGACNARISSAPSNQATPDAPDAVPDGADDAGLPAWSTPSKVPPAATTAGEDDGTLSSNLLELIFSVNGPDGKDLYYTSRTSTSAPWMTPATRLSFNSDVESDETPRLSADDRTLYFASGRDGNGTLDIYRVTRSDAGTWGSPQALLDVSTTTLDEKWFMPCGDGRYVMVQSSAEGDSDLVEGVLDGDAPIPIAALNSTANETGTFVSPDCLTIYYASARVRPLMIYRSQRATLTAAWRPPAPVTDFPIEGGNGNQEDPWLSSDGRTFAFASDASGSKDVYLSTR